MVKANIFKTLLLNSPLLLVLSCANAPDFGNTPFIEYVSISKDSLIQGSLNNDSLVLVLNFEDGDGDIGFENQSNQTNLKIIDTRIDEVIENIKTPFIPLQGTANGIRGTIELKIFTTCCIFPNGDPPCQANPAFPTNDLLYEIILEDRAGNVSNTVQTEIITLICN